MATTAQPAQPKAPVREKSFQSIGLGSAYVSTLRVVTHGFNSVGNVASALDATSKILEVTAYLGYAQKAKDLLSDLGHEATTPQEAIAVTDELVKSLRGY